MKYFIPFACFLFFCSCSLKTNKYLTLEEYNSTKLHKTIAILPPNVKYTGKIPKNIDDEQLQRIERFESEFFHESLIKYVKAQCKQEKTPCWVSILTYENTMQAFRNHQLTVQDTWNMHPAELAKILNVDAIYVTKIKQDFRMSQELAETLNTAEEVIEAITDINIFSPTKKTHKIYITGKLVTPSGAEFYDRSVRNAVTDNETKDDVVSGAMKSLITYFPYREYKIKKRNR